MSAAMTLGSAPIPASTSPAPRFVRTGLPLNSGEVAGNNRQQKRDEKAAWSRAATNAAAMGVCVPEPCCKSLQISLCFDGTNNHEPSDKGDPLCTSNVARLFHAAVDNKENGYFRYYSPGVGTVFEEIKEYEPDGMGLIGASGGEDRINWGLTRLIAALKETLTPAARLLVTDTQALVEAMSTNWAATVLSAGLLEDGAQKRQAAMRPYEQELAALLAQRKAAEQKPEILALRLYVYGFSRGAAQARTFVNWLAELTRAQGESGTEYRFAGLPISIEFLGLFDTVAAVGLADSAPFAAGHMSWADDTMRLPEDCAFLKRCVHLVAAHEQRSSFPLDSIRRQRNPQDPQCASTYRQGTVEFFYPGMHSDVGGGYPCKDQGKATGGQGELLSQIPLHHMYREAFAVGAPLQVPPAVLGDGERWRQMDEATQGEFDLAATLITRFNAWQAQAKGGPLEQVMERETALLTGWRIDRYAGGIEKQGFYSQVGKDWSDDKQAAYARLYKEKNQASSAAREGQPPPTLSAAEQAQHASDVQLIGGEAAHQRINLNKALEPALDEQQLRRAAAEFKRDYLRTWGPLEDTLSVGGVVNMLLGGTVFLLNEEDEAEEYAEIYQHGNERYHQLFVRPGVANPEQEPLVKLFDEQVHDSRAWFMNSSALGEREPFTDYFRYRLVHFDNASNKQLSVLATAGRVVGVGIVLASVGLTVKKRNPRYLLGLFLPALAAPVLTGKVGTPQVSAFDPLTGIALPMLQGTDALRAFSQKPGDRVSLLNAMPAPKPLTAQSANTPELQSILKAVDAAKAVQAAKQNHDASGLLGQALAALGDEPAPASSSPDWLAQAKGALAGVSG
jgi:hypothetical protein